MSSRSFTRATGIWLFALLTSTSSLIVGFQSDPVVLPQNPALSWRPIGPDRAGPITAVAGSPSRLGEFFAASEGAGLWKTTDFGAAWTSVFDGAPAGVVTALTVDDSGTAILVATRGSSRGLLHRSDDGGTTWRGTWEAVDAQITHVTFAPADTTRVFVTLASGPDEGTSGTYLSTDGGNTFTRVLDAADGWAGGGVFAAAGSAPNLVGVGRIPGLEGPGAEPPVVVSRDGGRSWHHAQGVALPAGEPVAIDIAAAAQTTTYLLITADTEASVYRSIDGGGSWTKVEGRIPSIDAATTPRLGVGADGTLLIAGERLYASRDEGRTFTEVDTPIGSVNLIWAHPATAGAWLAAGPEGATITVNGADTWSAPDRLPGAVIGRVVVDAAFPYRVCAMAVAGPRCTSAGHAGGSPDWQPLPAVLGDRVVPDPLDEHVVWGGAGVRYDRRSDQITHVAPVLTFTSPHQASVPIAFSSNGRTILAATDRVWRSTNAGAAWEAVSPTLTATAEGIVALAISGIDARTLWAGTDDGRVFVTGRDAAGAWSEAARPLARPASIRAIEPSRFDPNSAYVVVVADGTSALRPEGRLLRTRDDGATWVDIGARIDEAGSILAIREDPYRRGLLFAGTDRSVFVSFDDGEHWQPLALNMPAVAVTDLAIKDADLLAATAGRGVWLLEDFSPLRQMTADVLQADFFLFRPAQTWRVRASADASAPEGRALLSYALAVAADEVTLEVVDTTTGDLIRRFSSDAAADTGVGVEPRALPTAPGVHRVAWDLRHPRPASGGSRVPAGTRVVPGTYQVRLIVDGRVARQTVTIRLDPRLRTSIVDLTAQRDLGRALDAARANVQTARDAGNRGPELSALAEELNRLAAVLQQTDGRPAPAVEAAIESAVGRVGMALGFDTR